MADKINILIKDKKKSFKNNVHRLIAYNNTRILKYIVNSESIFMFHFEIIKWRFIIKMKILKCRQAISSFTVLLINIFAHSKFKQSY